MQPQDLEIIKPALIAKKEALKHNEVEEVYSYLYRHIQEYSDVDPLQACAKLTTFFTEQGIDPFFYLTDDTIPSGMYGTSSVPISNKILSPLGKLSFNNTTIIRILGGGFVDRNDIIVADLSKIKAFADFAFWKCNSLKEVIFDADVVTFCPDSADYIKGWGSNIQTLKVKNYDRCKEPLKHLIWETDNYTSINVETI